MKKLCLPLLCLLALLLFTACGGNTKHAEIIEKESKIYTDSDISSAIETIKKEFDENWDGCTLKEIYYPGDSFCKKHQAWANSFQEGEFIILLSSFDVDSSGGDGSLNPNTTYDDFIWVLVRDKGGKWRHVDHGY